MMINGEIVASDERYVITDVELAHQGEVRYTVSETFLRPGQNTRGHSHVGQDEVYVFLTGSGKMVVGDKEKEIMAGDTAYVPRGIFHQVKNEGNVEPLVFLAFFQGSTRRPSVVAQ